MSLLAIELTDGSILIAIAASVSAMGSVALTGWISGRRQKQEWARQDLIAERAAVEALAQRKSQAAIVEQAGAAARRAVADTARLQRTVDQVHVLVNSTLTASLSAQVVALEQLVDLMNADLDRRGSQADRSSIDRRDATVEQLDNLRGVIGGREVATHLAAEQLEQAEARDEEGARALRSSRPISGRAQKEGPS